MLELHLTAITCNSIPAILGDSWWCFHTPFSPFPCELGNIRPPRDVPLLIDGCGVLGSVGQRLFSLARGSRTHSLLPVRYRYGAWPHNLSHDPPHARPTSDARSVATGHHHLGGTCP